MLHVDTGGSSEKRLRHLVARACSRYGAVKQVDVCFDALSRAARPFALVCMGTAAESCQLVAAFGGRIVGSAVLVLLQPREK